MLELLAPGLFTAKVAEPLLLTSAAGIAAARWDASTNVVVRSAPFHTKTAPGTKLDPAIVSVKLAPPAVVLEQHWIGGTGESLAQKEDAPERWIWSNTGTLNTLTTPLRRVNSVLAQLCRRRGS